MTHTASEVVKTLQHAQANHLRVRVTFDDDTHKDGYVQDYKIMPGKFFGLHYNRATRKGRKLDPRKIAQISTTRSKDILFPASA